MGKLVNLARTADLARDPDSVDAKKAPKDATKERKRMLWWEIMFYDTLVKFLFVFGAATNLESIAGSSRTS
jgi:hypothetical protein